MSEKKSQGKLENTLRQLKRKYNIPKLMRGRKSSAQRKCIAVNVYT